MKTPPLHVRIIPFLSVKGNAIAFGVSESSVSKAAKRAGVKLPRHRMPPKPRQPKKRPGPKPGHTMKYDWLNIDWSKSTPQISRETGACQKLVSFRRRKHAPDTLAHIRLKSPC